uniref:F-box and leucine rich repeat protein 17 n=1 Tax=Anolis carolinensis TaxID=28377 RepID=A0A803STW5_ANOCA
PRLLGIEVQTNLADGSLRFTAQAQRASEGRKRGHPEAFLFWWLRNRAHGRGLRAPEEACLSADIPEVPVLWSPAPESLAGSARRSKGLPRSGHVVRGGGGGREGFLFLYGPLSLAEGGNGTVRTQRGAEPPPPSPSPPPAPERREPGLFPPRALHALLPGPRCPRGAPAGAAQAPLPAPLGGAEGRARLPLPPSAATCCSPASLPAAAALRGVERSRPLPGERAGPRECSASARASACPLARFEGGPGAPLSAAGPGRLLSALSLRAQGPPPPSEIGARVGSLPEGPGPPAARGSAARERGQRRRGERRPAGAPAASPRLRGAPRKPRGICVLSRGSPPAQPREINQLPPCILLRIFSNLSLNERCLSASLVCKYWRDLCLDFQFWKQLDLSSRQQVTDELLERIASRSQNITEINISDCRNVSDTGVCVLASKCPGLLRYTAYRCKQLSDTSIIAVASQCPQLQKVHVGNQDRLTDEGLKQVTDQSVKAFAEHCPELQYVGFMGCSVTSKGVIHLTNLRNLSSLDLRHITELDNETVMEIVKRCKNLTSLNLCLNWIINDRCVEVIAKEGQNLKELYLVSCKITDYALIAIGRYSMTIETVDVGWCKEITDQGATQIAQCSKSLRYLGLMRCDKVNEVTVEQLVQQHPHITFSTVLQDCKRTLERAYQMGWTPNMSTAS